MISKLYWTCWLLARNTGLLFLKAICALALVSSTFADQVTCSISPVVLLAYVDPSHFRMAIAVQIKCSDGRVKIYHSREAVVTTTDPKAVESGALVMRAMAVEVASEMNADGAKVTDQGLLEHAQLIDTDAAAAHKNVGPHPSPTDSVGL